MRELTKLQEQVIAKAKETLKNKKWFKGVCIDLLQTDEEIRKRGINSCAKDLIADTIFYDCPSDIFLTKKDF